MLMHLGRKKNINGRFYLYNILYVIKKFVVLYNFSVCWSKIRTLDTEGS